ncbi:hypothetical protein [Ornithinibacillus salinisoli]|uniref:hypothetical protein n=1 Tax=Ornithinibacillus salinisoli TaxID=1848459 RepID=UPI00366B1A08
MSQFNNKISKTIRVFYKDESVLVQYDWWDEVNNVKGRMLEHTYNGQKQQFDYVITFTVLPIKTK